MTKRKFKRGEARALSIDIVEKHLKEGLDKIAERVGEALGFDEKKARGHVRWLVREGFINDKEKVTAAWKRKVTAPVAKKGAPKTKKAAATKTVSKKTRVEKKPGGGTGGVKVAKSTETTAPKNVATKTEAPAHLNKNTRALYDIVRKKNEARQAEAAKAAA